MTVILVETYLYRNKLNQNKKPMYRLFSVHVNIKNDGGISHEHIRFRRDYKAIRRKRS